ncbi:glycosyltransferase family 4 protein [Vibrio harveyi]|uniref:glycosyltransferase family 4 protein n=1 Tax=Vibrio harveyi TaxID=669 RepID=UPI003BB6E7E6
MNYKVSWLVLWPVYYHVPIYREINRLENIELEVLYCDDTGIKPYFEKEMGVMRDHNEFDLLSEYNFKILKNWVKHNNDKGFFTLFNPSIVSEIINKKPDAIMIQGYDSLTHILAMLTAKVMGVKVICRGEAVLRGNEERKSIRNFIKTKFLRIWVSLCDAIMYSCKGNKQYWTFYGAREKELFEIPCAVDNDYYSAEYEKYLPRKLHIKQDLGIDKDDFVVIFSARFTNRKRPFDLLKSVGEIDSSKITILFVGDGDERAKMEEYAEENNIKAVFVGFKNQEEITKYYSIADLYVVISDYDPSPKAMNEAMNFSLPIIVTENVGTSKDLVVDNYNGFIVHVGDISSIAEKIDLLNKDRKLSLIMGERSKKMVKEWNFKKNAINFNNTINYVMEK